jgi:cytochrome oxidase Cu insertion factor (SCO1/SenC/PrrC family)
MKRTTKIKLICVLLLIGIGVIGFNEGSQAVAQKREAKKASAYYCVMDPEVRANRPGSCPKCGMALREVKETDGPPKLTPNTADDPDAIKDFAKPRSIPDVTVYDQDGQMLHFYSDLVKGKTVAINFIFTTCTTICPPLAASFRRVQVELGNRVGGDIRLISISVDPVTDVPARLKAFGAKFKAGPGWTFVTGSRAEIDTLLKALGAAVSDKNDHTPMMLLGNEPAGFWTRTYGLAPTASIVRVISDVASKVK